MAYKYILTAVSSVGDTHQKTDEFYFADGLSSVVKDACNSVRTRVKCIGRKHIFSVVSCRDRFHMLCDYLSHALMKRNSDKVRIKVQYALRTLTDEIYSMASREPDANMSMLYIDGSNIYASGFGTTHIYHTSKKSPTPSKVTFSTPSLSDAILLEGDADESGSIYTWSKFIGEIKEGDEYLVAGSWLQSVLGDETICDELSSLHIDSPASLIEKAHSADSSRTVTALHILVKKKFPTFWVSLGASLFVIALALLLLI